jgi:hypothetical protein
MRRLFVLLALVPLVAACGSHENPVEKVARSWSKALNSGDNVGAAKLFATDARVVQGSYVRQLHTLSDAIRWNAALPCSGRITDVVVQGDTITATFLLGSRPGSPCDAPGETAAAEFTVRDGKIVLWRQLADNGGATV